MSNGIGPNGHRYDVCPDCGGKGTKDRLGGFTGRDMDEWYGDDHEAREDFADDYRRGGYDESCPTCKGNRVMTHDDIRDWHSMTEDRAQQRAEMRMYGDR